MGKTLLIKNKRVINKLLDTRLLEYYDRGGVIFYAKINNNIKLLLGYNKKYNDFSDFGGAKKGNETLEKCVNRELMEETKKLFKPIKKKNIKFIICYKNNSKFTRYEMFVEIKYNKNIINKFRNKINNYENNEIDELKWINLDKIMNYKKNNILCFKRFEFISIELQKMFKSNIIKDYF
jgi:hypothetical protein